MKINFDQEDFNMLNEYIINYVSMMSFSERELLDVLLKYIPNRDKINVMRVLYMLGENDD